MRRKLLPPTLCPRQPPIADEHNRKAATIADSLPQLQKQYNDLTSQFHGFSTPSTAATLAHPNDPALAPDFAHAISTKPAARTSSPGAASDQRPAKKSGPKTVRFSDAPSDLEAQAAAAAATDDDDPSARALFGRYRDDPSQSGTPGYRDRDRLEAQGLDNVQVHEYHQQVMEEQDAHLDALGASLGRQRELSMQIGDELDTQVLMLDESERVVDRHQGRLDRARRQLGRVARTAGESKQMVAIVVLIVVLVLLIAASR